MNTHPTLADRVKTLFDLDLPPSIPSEVFEVLAISDNELAVFNGAGVMFYDLSGEDVVVNAVIFKKEKEIDKTDSIVITGSPKIFALTNDRGLIALGTNQNQYIAYLINKTMFGQTIDPLFSISMFANMRPMIFPERGFLVFEHQHKGHMENTCGSARSLMVGDFSSGVMQLRETPVPLPGIFSDTNPYSFHPLFANQMLVIVEKGKEHKDKKEAYLLKINPVHPEYSSLFPLKEFSDLLSQKLIEKSVTSVTLSPDKKFLAMSGDNGVLTLFDCHYDGDLCHVTENQSGIISMSSNSPFRWSFDNYFIFIKNPDYGRITLLNPLNSSIAYPGPKYYVWGTSFVVQLNDGSILCHESNFHIRSGEKSYVTYSYSNPALADLRTEFSKGLLRTLVASPSLRSAPLEVLGIIADYSDTDYSTFPAFVINHSRGKHVETPPFHAPDRLPSELRAKMEYVHTELSHKIAMPSQRADNAPDPMLQIQLNHLTLLAEKIKDEPHKSIAKCIEEIWKLPAFIKLKENSPSSMFQTFCDEIVKLLKKEKSAATTAAASLAGGAASIAPAHYPENLRKKFVSLHEKLVLTGQKKQADALETFAVISRKNPTWSGEKCFSELFSKPEFSSTRFTPGAEFQALRAEICKQIPEQAAASVARSRLGLNAERKETPTAESNTGFDKLLHTLQQATSHSVKRDEQDLKSDLEKLRDTIAGMNPRTKTPSELVEKTKELRGIFIHLPKGSAMHASLAEMFPQTPRAGKS